MKPSYLLSKPSTIIALVIVGVALVANALFFSFHDLEESLVDGGKQAHPSLQVEESRILPTELSPTSSMVEPATESSPTETTTEASPDSGATPGMDPAPPVGSEPPVPAAYGLLAETNFTNQPAAQGIQAIAEEFTDKVKQGGWDTTSEAYRINWEKAAQEADDVLRARYGTETFLNLQRNPVP
jgi:hypothetical protein